MDDFHEERQKGIGGSDVPVLIGKSPYKSPYQLYLEKRGLTEPEPEPDNGALYFGKTLEPLILSEFEKRQDIGTISLKDTFFIHPKHKFMLAHLDAYIPVNGTFKEVVEAKTANQFMASEWGEEFTDEIPEAYILQCQHYMAVVNAKIAWVPVLIGGNDFRIYKVDRNDKLINGLIEVEADFWKNNVEAGIPPDVDGSESTAKHLAKLYPKSTEVEIEAPDSIINELIRLTRIKGVSAKIDEIKKLAENRVKIFLKDNSTAVRNGKKLVTWNTAKDTTEIDYKAICADIDVPDEIKAKHTTVSTGSRRFLPKHKILEELSNDAIKQRISEKTF